MADLTCRGGGVLVCSIYLFVLGIESTVRNIECVCFEIRCFEMFMSLLSLLKDSGVHAGPPTSA
jgi:hypothetical protein